MGKRDILKNKYYLYLTEFFSGMADRKSVV